ncbi:MAG TPA: NAD(P)-dependent oxidoreductase [Terriglobales bacterium]|jgi:nucleoside-diphosphate-sugar epimerase|nr:NAD(P)-dependent oxidoreductase [Terriglobales bacterium]
MKEHDPQKILVTGAAGFIGRATCAELRRQGAEFVGFDRIQTEDSEAVDLSDPNAAAQLFRSKSFGAVIHLAALLPSASAANPFHATQMNVCASIALLETAVASGVRRFIFGSSTSVYGSMGLTVPIAEDTPAAPSDTYGGAKRFVEIVGENLSQKRAIEFSALRIATVVGPGARNTSSPWRSELFEKLGTERPQQITLPYCGEDLLTVVHVEDVARMLVAMACSEALTSCVYNTPAELCKAEDLKRWVETADRNVKVVLGGRSRPLAPLADGRKFAMGFDFKMTSIEKRLRSAAGKTSD